MRSASDGFLQAVWQVENAAVDTAAEFEPNGFVFIRYGFRPINSRAVSLRVKPESAKTSPFAPFVSSDKKTIPVD